MKRKILILLCCTNLVIFAQEPKENPQEGIFEPTWESLKQYEAPEWFRDAKFGIWAHWGPQCQPEQGDWYARYMYVQGDRRYNYHIEHYGHPSEVGFKEVIHDWKAEEWDPDKLVALYKRAGARYFFAMGNHHDNLDLWDSKYQEWNSVNVGPQQNILEGWAQAARNNDLPFGVSIHSSHAWIWYETSRRSDTDGEYAGVPYDGILTKKDGTGTWWEGMDPQDLYAQNHLLSEGSENPRTLHNQWTWGNGAAIPSEAYCTKFYNRCLDMINTYHPDLIYFDDTGLPLWPVSDVGLEIAAHYYNQNRLLNNGETKAVLFGKVLTDEQKECLVWDVERGAPDAIQEKPWQTCTCIGGWHYDRSLYENDGYKSAKTVIQMLVDIVSKNGNLLLNIPVRGNGSIDDKELAVLEGITAWMDTNSECIYETRPWHIYGEGPKAEKANPIKGQGFNENKGDPYTSQDIRFTQKGDTLYAVVMDSPGNNEVLIRSLSKDGPMPDETFNNAALLGGEILSFEYIPDGLKVVLAEGNEKDMPVVIKLY